MTSATQAAHQCVEWIGGREGAAEGEVCEPCGGSFSLELLWEKERDPIKSRLLVCLLPSFMLFAVTLGMLILASLLSIFLNP